MDCLPIKTAKKVLVSQAILAQCAKTHTHFYESPFHKPDFELKPISLEKSSQIHFKRKKKFKKIGLCKMQNFETWHNTIAFATNWALVWNLVFEIDFSCWLALRKQILLAKKALHLFFFLLKKQDYIASTISTNVAHIWDLIFFYPWYSTIQGRSHKGDPWWDRGVTEIFR